MSIPKHALPIMGFVLLLLSGGVALAQAITVPETNAPGVVELIRDNRITATFCIIGLGLLLGSVRVFGISLGSSGVIFVAIAFGAWGAEMPSELGNFGLVLFVYCIGLAAGPGFFRAFHRQGPRLAKLSTLIVATGAVTTGLCAMWLGISAAMAAGVFAGAMTSTPGLAAALNVFEQMDPQLAPDVSVGYGIAYPFGVIGVVLFVQLLPRLLGRDIDEEARKLGSGDNEEKTIKRALIEVRNPSVFGRPIEEVRFVRVSHCQISRVLREGKLRPINPQVTFEEGMLVLAVGDEDHLQDLSDFLGRASDKPYIIDTESERLQVVATSRDVVGKKLRYLNLINSYGITISRIIRHDMGFVPDADTVIYRGDVLFAVGEPDQLQEFANFAGHRVRVLDETDLISLSVGVVAGVLLGVMPIVLPGGSTFQLGLAGGPMLVALLLSHFGGIGRIRGHMPRAARLLMTEIGLVFFLAYAGAQAGARFGQIIQSDGPLLLLMGALVTLVPMIAGYFYARFVLKLNFLETLGGTCGSMTSTPGLGAITNKTDSEIPTVSYAAAYPVALILMTLSAKLLVTLLR
jgi:putative transport protein